MHRPHLWDCRGPKGGIAKLDQGLQKRPGSNDQVHRMRTVKLQRFLQNARLFCCYLWWPKSASSTRQVRILEYLHIAPPGHISERILRIVLSLFTTCFLMFFSSNIWSQNRPKALAQHNLQPTSWSCSTVWSVESILLCKCRVHTFPILEAKKTTKEKTNKKCGQLKDWIWWSCGKKEEASDKAQTQRVDWASASSVRIHDSMPQDLVTLCSFHSDLKNMYFTFYFIFEETFSSPVWSPRTWRLQSSMT